MAKTKPAGVMPDPPDIDPAELTKVSAPALSAVDVVAKLTAPRAPGVHRPLITWRGLQYGCDIEENGVSLYVPALANGLPQLGEICEISLRPNRWHPMIITNAKIVGDRLALGLEQTGDPREAQPTTPARGLLRDYDPKRDGRG